MNKVFNTIYGCLLICGWMLIFFCGQSDGTKVSKSDNVTITQLVKLCCSDHEVFDITTQKCLNITCANLVNGTKMDVLNKLIDTKGKGVITNTIDEQSWDKEKYKIAYKYQADTKSKVKFGENKLVVQRIYSEYFRFVISFLLHSSYT